MARKNESVEEVLGYIGITHDNVRQDAYNHWQRFIQFMMVNTPADWKQNIRPKLRSYIGVDFRYIDDYYQCCLSWGIIKSHNGIVEFVGIPNQEKESFVEHIRNNPHENPEPQLEQKQQQKKQKKEDLVYAR